MITTPNPTRYEIQLIEDQGMISAIKVYRARVGADNLSLYDAKHKLEFHRDSTPAIEPASLTTLTEDGWLLTVIDRPPTSGELGFWVLAEDIVEIAAEVMHDANKRFHGYGWSATKDYEAGKDEEGMHAITIECVPERDLSTHAVELTQAQIRRLVGALDHARFNHSGDFELEDILRGALAQFPEVKS